MEKQPSGTTALDDLLQNPLTKLRDDNDRARLVSSFPVLLDSPQKHFLVLRRYLDRRPEKFLNRNTYDSYLHWLQRRDHLMAEQLKTYLAEFDGEICRALLSLEEINSEEWHDDALTNGNGYELDRMIDKHIHPAYLRLIEAVLVPLLRPVAYFSRIDRQKSTEGLEAWPIVQELKGQPEERLAKQYEHTVRNGIAHGGISFLQDHILYRGQQGNEETIDKRYLVRLLDDLVDTCNGLAAALKVFYLISHHRGYMLPRELLVEALQEQTRTPWWTIEGCVEGEVPGKSQLTVYATPDSRDYSKVLWSAIQSGILAESLVPGYGRYFLSLHSRKALPGWAAFDGGKLLALREAEITDLSQHKGILEDNLVFYVPRPAIPKILRKFDTLATILRVAVAEAVQGVRDSLGIPRIFCRNATVHRNSWGAVLRSEVVIEGIEDEEVVEVVRKNRHRIVRLAKQHASKQCGVGFAAKLPVGFARVAVFRRDYRRRRLTSFGLGDDLVCTVTLQRISRIQSPNLIGSTVEANGKWRIAWNRGWLDTGGQTLLERTLQD